MGFTDQLKTFANSAASALESEMKALQQRAEERLSDLLGTDRSKVEKITLDPACGKFYGVVAPEDVISKIRNAGLLKE